MKSTLLLARSTGSAYGAGILTPSIRHTWLALFWCLTVSGSAWAQVDVVTIIKEEPI